MSRSFIAFMIGSFILVSIAFYFVLYQGSILPSPASPSAAPAAASVPQPLPSPSVSLTIQKGKGGNTLFVQWCNLPDNTTALDIFRSLKNKNDWRLWQTVGMTSSTLTCGNASFDIGSLTYSSYSFYLQAVGGNASPGSGTNQEGQGVLWTSVSTTAPIATSTTSTTNTNTSTNTSTNTQPSSTNSTSTSTNSTTTTATTTQNTTNQTTTSQSTTTTVTPSGTPYYTPELQISGYGQSPGGIFWVQHVDQKIQLGWQNLPPVTTNIVVSRSLGQSGPWTQVLSQQNVTTSTASSYSIQLVDDTLGQTYYYELNALAGTSLIATYGPVELKPVSQ